MHRNLDRRVEALVRLTDPGHLSEIEQLFDMALDDKTSSWHLESEGTWTRHSVDEAGEPLTDLQDWLMLKTSRKRRTRVRR
jgi:polyphosphate kinase